MKALEKNRARRYETATGLAHDIQRYLNDEPVAACPPSVAYRLRKFARRNRAALSVAGLIVLVLVVLGSGINWTLRDRSARLARTSQQVALILDEVARLEQNQQWPAARAAAGRAEAVLAAGGAHEDLRAGPPSRRQRGTHIATGRNSSPPCRRIGAPWLWPIVRQPAVRCGTTRVWRRCGPIADRGDRQPVAIANRATSCTCAGVRSIS